MKGWGLGRRRIRVIHCRQGLGIVPQARPFSGPSPKRESQGTIARISWREGMLRLTAVLHCNSMWVPLVHEHTDPEWYEPRGKFIMGKHYCSATS